MILCIVLPLESLLFPSVGNNFTVSLLACCKATILVGSRERWPGALQRDDLLAGFEGFPWNTSLSKTDQDESEHTNLRYRHLKKIIFLIATAELMQIY